MTAVELTRVPRLRGPVPTRWPVVPVTMAVVLASRLLLVNRPASPDEGGFLVVGSQWHVGGTSLYGSYWVDRPPLLIGIFQLADVLGGLAALRLIGALSAAVAVGLLAATSGRVFGRRAGCWTAVAAAALLVSPLVGAEVVDGELLAVPFVALGLRLAVEAAYTDDALAARAAALGTGVAAVLALMVKQNMADVVVFALGCWLVAWRTRRMTTRTCADLLVLACAGAALGYAVVMLWAMAHGTSPLAVYEATYPFRVRAGHVLAAMPHHTAEVRLSRLGLSALLSAGPLVIVGFLLRAVRRSVHPAVIAGTIAAAAWATASILAGGSYWLHYLVQGVPAVALATGALAASAPRLNRLVVSLAVASSAVSLTASAADAAPAPGSTVGRALAAAARPGDTVLSAFGDAEIPLVTGMSSPYPYLWSLPSRTLDPRMTLLRGILSGPEAPTWIVVRGGHTMQRLGAGEVGPVIEHRYRVVGTVCGRAIYLVRGLDRSPLGPTGRCGGLVLP
jgi:hypothetical protein